MLESPPKGNDLFRVHWILWQFLGIPLYEKTPPRFYLYSIFLNVVCTIYYPVHLFLGVIQSESQYEFFKNIIMCLPVSVCSFKFCIFWWNMGKVRKIERILEKCEQSMTSADEREYYKNESIPSGRRIINLFYFICIGASLTSEIMVLGLGIFTGNWQLMFPAYFPFDVQQSKLHYTLANLYQWVAESVICAMNFNNDTYGAVNIALINGHVHMLGMRVSRIGKNPKESLRENNEKLVQCIQDYRTLLEYYGLIQNIISFFTLIQLTVTCVTLGITIVFLIYFVDDYISYAYYSVFLLGITMELFPICHQGSLFEYEMDNLTKCIFDCNWIDQNKQFKQNLRIFAEQTLKKRSFRAGKMLNINYAMFLATCKTAYTLFAVIIQTK